MPEIHCTNEDKELQLILERNPNILPGDQINPEEPRRWLLIKREMPVPDPATGQDRWSIDFLFADQDAIPTFVECKRFLDTRSRREVVGQIIEYAANGHYYWDKAILREFAEKSANEEGVSLEGRLAKLDLKASEYPEDFFDSLQQNLREGQLRIIFFMEEAPPELRSVVDFLNKQMERSEVLLVEAKQYEVNGSRIIVPSLFGYTEEARQAKRIVTVKSSATTQIRRKWDEAGYFNDAKTKLQSDDVAALNKLYQGCLDMGFEISWGTGTQKGSFNIKDSRLCKRSLISVWSNGNITFNYHWLDENIKKELMRIEETIFLVTPESDLNKAVDHKIYEWNKKVEQLLEMLGNR